MSSDQADFYSSRNYVEQLAALQEALRQFCEVEYGGNESEMARALGWSQPTLHRTLNSPVNKGNAESVWMRLAYLEFLLAEHEGFRASGYRRPAGARFLEDRAQEGIPVVGRIAAGQMMMMEYIDHHAEDRIPVDPTGLSRGQGDVLFGLRITGDSMLPWMYEGDVAICSLVQTIDVGDDICYYAFETGESTIKRLDAWQRKENRVRLRPINPLYDPIIVNLKASDQVKRVVGLWRDYQLVRPRRQSDY